MGKKLTTTGLNSKFTGSYQKKSSPTYADDESEDVC